MTCVNDRYFFDPQERALSRKVAATGISIPDEDKLRPGEVVYRIGHSDKSHEAGIAGLWWMRAATFEYLSAKASRDDPQMRPDRAFRKLFRLKLAVEHSFGRSDVVIRAHVLQPLRVWTGKGRFVQDTTSAPNPVSWIGGTEIAQICIPGLMVKSAPPSTAWTLSATYYDWLVPEPPKELFSWFNGSSGG